MIRIISKKGQFYLFIAIILSISAYALLQPSITAKEGKDEFDLIYENYIHEAENVINSALYNGSDVYKEIDKYTLHFIDYAKGKNTDFKILYMIKLEDEIRAVNYLSSQVNITNKWVIINPREYRTFNNTYNIIVSYESVTYNYSFTDGNVQLKALLEK